VLFIFFFLSNLLAAHAESRVTSTSPVFLPCDPVSELLKTLAAEEPVLSFCAKWNPDFAYNGRTCCGKPVTGGRKKKRAGRCSPKRPGGTYCGEMTEEQKAYTQAVNSGKYNNILDLITHEMGSKGDQSFCTVNNGFLAYGRPILGTSENRIVVKSPERCLNFGTDAMAGMVEWLGLEVGSHFPSKSYSSVNLNLGDVSGPKGGCLYGRSGRRGHASHTSGQDADIGFISLKNQSNFPSKFSRQFEPSPNWWFLKRVFKNPFACVKVIFLDKRHIRTLTKFARLDSDWKQYGRFIRHMPGHKNHFHVRVGNGPGLPGCVPNAKPELEIEEDSDSMDDVEAAYFDDLKSRQSSNIQEEE
jgi:murein endopeptidase